MDIKHLVISSGGPSVLNQMGAFSLLIEKKIIEFEKIKNIYACSSGGFISFLFCLNMNFKEITTYFIERPWQKLFSIDFSKMINLYDGIGLFHLDNMKEMLKPLFKSKKISIDITFKELFEINKKNLNIFCTNHDTFNFKKFSHKETPDMKVIEAVYMSCTVPFLLKPIKYNNVYYIDGVYSSRFPIKHLLNDHKDINFDEIFGMDLMSVKKMEKTNYVEHNIFSFNMDIILKLMNKNNKNNKNNEDLQHIKNIFNLVVDDRYSLNDVYNLINNIDFRKEKIKKGYVQCNIFLMNKYNL